MEEVIARTRSPLLALLADRWWVMVIRGVAAVLFGILTWLVPGASLYTLVLLWGVYALVDGISNLMLGVKRGRAGERWGWLITEGLLSVAAGFLTFARPGITALVLLYVIAVWAVLTGIAEVAAASRLRGLLENDWLLMLAGVLSIVFGILLFAKPGSGALALAWLIGSYAILFGGLLLGLGARLYRLAHPRHGGIPTRGASTPA